MAGKIRTQLRPRLQVKPLAKNLIRAQVAGEIASALGANEKAVICVQTGFARGLLRQAIYYAVQNHTDRYQEKVTFSADHTDGSETVEVEDDNGRSMVERVDEGLAEAVRRTATRFSQEGLTTQVRVYLVDEIANDPAQKAAAYAELGLTDVPWIEPADDYDIIDVATIRPGRDLRQSIQFFRGRKR